jgi:hypothetical protein
MTRLNCFPTFLQFSSKYERLYYQLIFILSTSTQPCIIPLHQITSFMAQCLCKDCKDVISRGAALTTRKFPDFPHKIDTWFNFQIRGLFLGRDGPCGPQKRERDGDRGTHSTKLVPAGTVTRPSGAIRVGGHVLRRDTRTRVSAGPLALTQGDSPQRAAAGCRVFTRFKFTPAG